MIPALWLGALLSFQAVGRRHHSDFCRVRLGVGDRAMFSLVVPEEQNPVQPYDPIMMDEVNSVVAHYRVVRGMPVTVNLDRAGQVAIIGDRKSVLCAARSMLLQVAALHAPDDVGIAVRLPGRAAPPTGWAWTCCPTTLEPELFDGPVPRAASHLPRQPWARCSARPSPTGCTCCQRHSARRRRTRAAKPPPGDRHRRHGHVASQLPGADQPNVPLHELSGSPSSSAPRSGCTSQATSTCGSLATSSDLPPRRS